MILPTLTHLPLVVKGVIRRLVLNGEAADPH
jgi:hypothetical protein